jgi:hypothetical protein
VRTTSTHGKAGERVWRSDSRCLSNIHAILILVYTWIWSTIKEKKVLGDVVYDREEYTSKLRQDI